MILISENFKIRFNLPEKSGNVEVCQILKKHHRNNLPNTFCKVENIEKYHKLFDIKNKMIWYTYKYWDATL
jgi:hypothetical protein